jgi:tetratricopeptide (TPR) repeat protein
MKLGIITYLILIWILWVGTPSYTYAQFTPNQSHAYQEILNLKLKTAEAMLSKVNKNDAIDAYLKNYILVLQLLTFQHDSLYQAKKAQEEAILAQIKKSDRKSPYHRFLQAEIKIQWAIVKLIWGENLAAAWSIKRAYHLLEENEQLYPDFLPTKKSLGLLRVVLGSVPEKYQWFLQLFGLAGNIKQGLKNMQTVIEGNTIFSLETQLLLMLVQTYVLNEPEHALQVGVAVGNTHKNSLLAHFIYALISMKAGRLQGENKLLVLSANDANFIYSPFFDYLNAEICLLSGSYEQASHFYKLFLARYQGKNYVKNAYYRWFLSDWLNDKPQASRYLDSCLSKGQTQIELDKNAENFAKQRNFPHKALTQARLLTDGGLYEKAWQAVQQISEKELTNQKDRVELVYRKARILDRQGKYEDACHFYQKTMALSGSLPYYFAPNSALQLGYLYRDIFKDKSLAMSYFKKVLTYPQHEYKNSLDHKAKTALKQF